MAKNYRDKSCPNRFKECRLDQGLTQQQLAEKLGIKRRAIINHEKGYTIPNMTLILNMHRILNVSLDYLLAIDDSKNHIDYAYKYLGIDNEMINLLSSVLDEKKINRINIFIKRHYKEVII